MATNSSHRNQAGFTIIELMIATLVFSVLLLLVTVVLIGVGNLFYKGVNSSSTQDAVRTIIDDVSQDIKDSSAAPTQCDPSAPSSPCAGSQPQAYCIGNTRYSYTINTPLSSNNYVVWRDTYTGTNCVPISYSDAQNESTSSAATQSNGVELANAGSRLTAFNVGNTIPVTITVGLAFGDDSSLNLYASDQHTLLGINTTCKSQAGDQFCATASLSSLVTPRLASQ